MSDRPRLVPNLNKPLINAASMTSTITGNPTNIQGMPGISYDIVWTGAPVGTFSVQVSNTYSQDSQGNVITAGNWNTLPTSFFQGTYPVPAGSPGNGFLDVFGTEAIWVRLVYNFTSGTGSLTVVPGAKVW